MLNFNATISQLGLQEIPLRGQALTWSNMQRHPLLEKLDWCFVSPAWSSNFPATSVFSLARSTSDHVPWVVNIQSNVPKPPIFRFENYWLQLEDFHSRFQASWEHDLFQPDPAKWLMAKFKRARKVIHGWQKSLPNLAKLIVKAELIIQLMDFIEESRDLTIQEWNFKNALVHHLQGLLSNQRTYWKQRGQIKWAMLGDAGTKFFHANATSKHRHNSILSLSCDNGMVAFSRKDKEEVLFQAFKDRLGTSQPTSMVFNLSELIQPANNLSTLELPFSRSEIDQIIRNLPTNKSPDPDGFNTDFVRKCWPVIASDFYELCDKFYEGSICLESINGSYVTLIPKLSLPTSVGDYRPISLLNTSMKILTKLLANRLQLVITNLVHQNQYGLLKARTIQDCLAWAFEYISICHKSGKEIVILKLDFEKAFDKLEHAAIIDILRHKGFGDRWLHWISLILGSSTSQVLLNGVPGKRFHCRRGVLQGDPLSPLLFVLASDLLQSIINKAKDCGILKLPILLSCGSNFPIIQYADDTILILEACPRQLFFLKAMLNSFADSTGLHVKYITNLIFIPSMFQSRKWQC
jgi:hypothetical protein